MDQKRKAPFITSRHRLPEITLKAVILSILLTIILCASNAYLGLKVGTTVSASIPAAVISMGVLRFFKHSNVLENNIVQTTASIGEAVVAGIAYILPALLILHYWTHFNFLLTMIITILGGLFGVLTTSLIRKAMIEREDLRFPEGTAVGQVLKASAASNADLKPLLAGGIVGGLIALFQSGFRLVSDGFVLWAFRGNTVYGLGVGFSPALIAAGYIIGPCVAVSLIVGAVIGWIIGVPVLGHFYAVHHLASATATANAIWAAHIRYIGVGTMLVGGLWTLLILMKPVINGVRLSISAMHQRKNTSYHHIPRTDRDVPIQYIGWLSLATAILTFILLCFLFRSDLLHATRSMQLFYCLLSVVYAAIACFIFSSISAYFAGLVGSTNCPASGLIVASLMIFSLLSLLVFSFMMPNVDTRHAIALAAFVILVNTLVSCSITIANDSIQDLKSGQIVGATPWKQQVMLLVGVVVAALVIAPILNLLFYAYGIGGVFPRPGMPHSQMLAAPQAAMMAAVVKGVLTHHIPWLMIGIGAGVAAIAIFIDENIKKRGIRLPVLAVGLGIYLPLTTSVPTILGGLLAFFAKRRLHKRIIRNNLPEDDEAHKRLHRGLLVACGIVAGASLMGVVLAIPFAIAKSSDVLSLVSKSFTIYADGLGVLVTAALCFWFYHMLNKKNKAS
jgi:putative OPT family oligopeptide transporter